MNFLSFVLSFVFYMSAEAKCADLDGGFSICWTVTDQVITFTFAANTNSGGYIAMGFSPTGSMVGSNAVVGWSSLNVDPPYSFIGDYYLGAKDPSQVVVKNNQNLTKTALNITNRGLLTVTFTRPLNISTAPPALNPNGDNNLIWSMGALPPPNSETLSHHSERYHAIINLATGVVEESEMDPAIKAHAALMILGWIVFIFWGQMIARFGKSNPHWFTFHRGFVVTGLLLVLIAWCIGIFRIGSGTKKAHFALGTTAFVLLILQPINAACRPHPPGEGERMTDKRRYWNHLHHWGGRFALFFAFINIFIGLSFIDISSGLFGFYIFLLISFGFGFLFLQWRAFQKTKEQHEPKVLNNPAPLSDEV